jgi:hypothetical protein
MEGKMKKSAALISFVLLLAPTLVKAQWTVYDPVNYANALQRYYQLQQHLTQLRNTYTQVLAQYNLAVQMARSIEGMPARYRATFSSWRNVTAPDIYDNTGTWVRGVNSGSPPIVSAGYQRATTGLLRYTARALRAMSPDELERAKSQYASVELSDGANTTAMATVGAIRARAQAIDNQISNLEQDSFSSNQSLNSQISVLNKINAANVLMLRTLQDSNKLLLSLLEQQVILAKRQREVTTNTINADISRKDNLADNMARVTSTLAQSLQNFRMP